MKRRLDGLIWIGLGVSLLLALFLSPFASSYPDGLEKVSETRGFSKKGEGWKVWKYAPFSEYAIPWIKNEKVSTAVSGLIGTLAIFFIAMGIGKLIKRSTAQKALFLMILSFTLSSPAFALRPLTTDDAYTVDLKVPRPGYSGVGGPPAYRQAGRGTIRMKFPWLTFCSPLRAREAPPCLSRPIGMAGELHNSWIFFLLHVELSGLEKNLDQSL